METTTRYSEYNLPMSFATIDMIPTFDTSAACHMRGIPISCAESYIPTYMPATSQELDVVNQHGNIMYYPEIMDINATFGSMVELLQGSDLLRPYPPAVVMDENVPTTTLAGSAVSTDFYPAMTTTVIAPSLITPSSSPMVQNISHISMLSQPNVTYQTISPPISPPPSPINTTTAAVAGFPFDHAVPRVVPSQPEIPIAPAAVAAVGGPSNTIISHSHTHSPYPQPSVLSTRSNGRIPRIQPMRSVSGDKPKPKRTPDGKKPLHHCPEAGCNRTFTRSFNLRSHLNTHTNSRPYACTHCSWAFVRRHDLDRHVKSRHLEHKPFSCPGCGMQFGRSDALRRHLRVEKVCERRVAVNRRESV